jgi:PKD repeat protein
LLVGATSLLGTTASADVDYRNDGSVRFGSRVYPTREAYHTSPEFIASGVRCGTPAKDPAIMELIAASDCGMNSTTINQDYVDGRTLVIPVVFHVIQKTDGTTGKISPALIQSQVDILNEDYNAMTGTNGAMGNDAKIQFVLAKLDPQGNPTTGIDVVTNNTYFNDPGSSGQNAMKRALKWDTTKYLNIYTNNAGGGGILGYATFPQEEAGGPEDGVVLNWVYVGRNAPGGEPYDQGRTATHEVGHYLGLYHTFQSGCGNTNAPFTSGDLIGDTNREAQPNYGCSPVGSGCSGGGMSPIENYMDYSGDACMTKFTVQQVNRMRCSIMNYRWVNTPPKAAFTYTANMLDLTFTSTSTDAESNATALKYTWSFGDNTTATTQNPTHTYMTPGTYNVTLEVLDPGSGTSTTTQSVVVTASPPQPDAGVDTGSNGGSNGGANGDAGLGNNDNGDDTTGAGCCDTRGGGNASLFLGLSTLGLVIRRRRRK